MGLHIIIIGNPVDGLEFIGPFKTADDATRHASTDGNIDNCEWWIAPLAAADGEG